MCLNFNFNYRNFDKENLFYEKDKNKLIINY